MANVVNMKKSYIHRNITIVKNYPDTYPVVAPCCYNGPGQLHSFDRRVCFLTDIKDYLGLYYLSAIKVA